MSMLKAAANRELVSFVREPCYDITCMTIGCVNTYFQSLIL